MNAKTLSLVACLVWLAVCPPVIAGGSPDEDVPLDSWVYDAVFSLSTLGYFDQLLLHTQPYRRGEIATALAHIADSERTPGARILIVRLRAEFAEELQNDKAVAEPGHRLRLGIGVNSHIDQFERGFTKNRVGTDAVASLRTPAGVTVRTRLRFDTDGRHDSQFQGEYWKSKFTAWVDQAVVTFDWGRLQGAFGREFWRWGRSPVDAMLISDHSPPFDGLRLIYRGGSWSFSFHATKLGPMLQETGNSANRYLVAHRFDWRPHRRFEIALSEVMVFGGVNRPWELNYLNPFLPYYWEQLNTDTDDNPLWNLELSWRAVDGLELYGEWMIDDFQVDGSEPQQIGVLVGGVWWPGLVGGRLKLLAEYQRINTFVYGQDQPWNRFFHGSDINGEVVGIGSDLGTDSDRLTFRPRWHQSPLVDFSGLLEYVRRGVNRIAIDQEKGVPHLPFPSGTVERTLTVGAGLHIQSGGRLVIDLIGGYQKIENVGHDEGRDRDGPYFQLRLASLWWKTLGS